MSKRITIPPDMVGLSWWRAKDLTRILPFSTTHVAKLAKDGKIPAPVRIGGKLLWDPERMTAFLNEAISKSEARAA